MINMGQPSTEHLVSLDTDIGACAGSCLVWRLDIVSSARCKLGQTPRYTGAYIFCAADKYYSQDIKGHTNMNGLIRSEGKYELALSAHPDADASFGDSI